LLGKFLLKKNRKPARGFRLNWTNYRMVGGLRLNKRGTDGSSNQSKRIDGWLGLFHRLIFCIEQLMQLVAQRIAGIANERGYNIAFAVE
jgi:hypothetical protein